MHACAVADWEREENGRGIQWAEGEQSKARAGSSRNTITWLTRDPIKQEGRRVTHESPEDALGRLDPRGDP